MWFPGVLLGDFLDDIQMVPVAPFVFDVTFVVLFFLHSTRAVFLL
jgi:hypothetical protein